MNPERLLAHFETISKAPDAVARLRRFILDLAVRGKLVEQDPKDEPASELLRLIELQRRLATPRKTDARVSSSIHDSSSALPFDVPEGWTWVRLGDILLKLTDGTHHSPPNEPSGDFLYITAKNIKANGVSLRDATYVDKKVHDEIYARCNPERGDILYVKDGATTGVAAINDLPEPFSMLSSVALLKLPDCIFNELVLQFLRSPFFYQQMRGFMKGGAIPRVTLKRMAPALLPLPPLAEQHRIVAKVDELMALCDQLEAARQQREQCRERMVAASLQRFNQPSEDSASFRNDARFALQVLPSITTTPAQIKQLRQMILNLAVRGKLVEQDPEDEPVAAYLKLINARPAEREDFCVPHQWAWVSVGEVSTSRLGKMLDKTKNKGTERPYLRNINVRWLDFDLSDLLEMRFEDSELPEYELKRGDVLICEGGEPGRAAVWDDRARDIYFQKALHRVRFDDCVDPLFFVYALRCSALDERLPRYFTGTGISHFTGKSLKAYLFPLPPLAEQHRIVAKVEKLMALCDQLEQQLSQADQQRRGLLEALLAEALEESEPALASLA